MRFQHITLGLLQLAELRYHDFKHIFEVLNMKDPVASSDPNHEGDSAGYPDLSAREDYLI